jgi:hypothetical protein
MVKSSFPGAGLSGVVSYTILQRYHSPATTTPATAILQRLPFSGDYHSPVTAILRRLPFSSDCHSPATTILQRLPFSSDYNSPATTILQRLPFSSDYHSPATAIQFHKLSRIAIADLERAIAVVFRPTEAKRFQLTDSDLHDGAANTVVPTSNQGLNEASLQRQALPLGSLNGSRA